MLTRINTLVHVLERYLKTDIRYLLKGGAWLTSGSIIGMATGLLLSILYARYLMKDTYGTYRYVLSLISIAGIFSLPGIGTAITRSVARGMDGAFRACAKVIFFSSTGISVIALVVALYLNIYGNKEAALGVAIAALFVPLVEGLGSWRALLDGKKEFKKKTIWNSATIIFYTLVMSGAVVAIYFLNITTAAGVAILVGTYFITHAIPNIVFFFLAQRAVSRHAPPDTTALPYGIHLSLSGLPATVATYIDSILLFHFLGPASLAVYSFAITVPEQLKRLFTNIADMTFPKLAASSAHTTDPQELQKTLPQKLFRASLLTALIVLAYIAIAPLLYTLLFPRYIESIAFSQVFAISLILFPFGVFGNAIKVEGNLKKIYIYNIGVPLLQIALIVILIPLFGLWGAVWGRVSGRVINHLFAYVLFRL
jgi:O-antigen/teichoic acid export membrane protein